MPHDVFVSFRIRSFVSKCVYYVTASQSAFSIFGVKPTEAAPGVMTVSQEGVITNIGDDFNPATGQYTAPDNGTYVFVLNMIKDFNTALQCSIRRNDQSVAIVYVPYSDDYHMGSASAVLSLKQGDIVDVGNCTDIDAIISWTSFIGFKLEVDQSDPN